jgi:hypothetical protein
MIVKRSLQKPPNLLTKIYLIYKTLNKKVIIKN